MSARVPGKPYPQKPPLTDEELTAFLGRMTIARLATRNPDGTVHLAPVAFKYADGVLLLGTQAVTRKARNVARDPNVTVLVDDPAMPGAKGVLIYGLATLDAEGVLATRVEILERVMPRPAAEQQVEGMARAFEPAVIRVVPTKVVSWDYEKPGFVGG
ncbi:MAG TPA: pyridoxamine 5'-phosphate oxidase family protein [Candidatus Limnocylindrales bacterium]